MSALKYIRKHIKWVLVITLALGVKIFSLFPAAVENYYSTGIYPVIAQTQRTLFGWLPFSIGDLCYLALALWLFYISVRNIILLFGGNYSFQRFKVHLLRLAYIALVFYIVFNVAWGLNYDRMPVAHIMDLQPQQFDTSDLIALQNTLIEKVNDAKRSLEEKREGYPPNQHLYADAFRAYNLAKSNFTILDYDEISLKSSLFGWLGNYLGFTGYYNPLTGEAQVNATVPPFLRPYITTHEIGHQLGYAKENEANFVGYLAAANSRDPLFQYSTYLDLFAYTNRQLYLYDSTEAKTAANALDAAVIKDLITWREFNLSHQSFAEPFITWLYSKYLQANRQPQGIKTYGEVTGMLIAYFKKYGTI